MLLDELHPAPLPKGGGKIMGIGNQLEVVKSALGVVVPGSGPITNLVTALLGLAAERQSQLNRIEQKLDDVRDGPFRDGQEKLDEARTVPSRERQAAGEAANLFEQAHAIYRKEPESAWWPAVYASILRYALGDGDRARHWLRKAHDEGVEAIQARCATAGRESLGKASVSTTHARRGLIGLGGVFAFGLGLFAIYLLLHSGATGLVALIPALIIGVIFANLWEGDLFKAGEAAGEAAAVPLERRYHQRLQAAQELAKSVDAMVDFGERQLKMPRGTLSRYEIQTSQEKLAIAYVPTPMPATAIASP